MSATTSSTPARTSRGAPSPHIRVERNGAVATLIIDRRDRFNSLDVVTAQDLRRAALALARDPAVRCVVLTGAGGVFCSGADLKYIRAGGGEVDLGYLRPQQEPEPDHGYGEVFKQILEYLHSTISEIRRAPKPFIAAVEGIAAAGGLGLAMCCDLVFAAETAHFEWAYGRTGLTGAESSTFFLPRLVGMRKALEMVFLNPRMTATEAKDAGLVTGVIPAADFAQDVAAIAFRIAAGPTAAFAETKALLNESMGAGALDVHLDRELAALARIADGPDFAEGIESFFAKRAPSFTGKG